MNCKQTVLKWITLYLWVHFIPKSLFYCIFQIIDILEDFVRRDCPFILSHKVYLAFLNKERLSSSNLFNVLDTNIWQFLYSCPNFLTPYPTFLCYTTYYIVCLHFSLTFSSLKIYWYFSYLQKYNHWNKIFFQNLETKIYLVKSMVKGAVRVFHRYSATVRAQHIFSFCHILLYLSKFSLH